MILGTAQLGLDYGISNKSGKPSIEKAHNLLKFALNTGVTILDTAAAYGDSEQVIGDSGLSSKFQIISKLPKIDLNQSNLSSIVETGASISLNRLKVNSLYAYLLHSVDDLVAYGEALWEQLETLKSGKKTFKIGYSVYSPEQLNQVYHKFKPDIIQIPMNVLDREFEITGWLNRLKDDGVEVHVRSVFLQGLLLMPKEEQIQKFPKHQQIWEEWHTYLDNHHITALEACNNFISNNNLIDEMVIGVNSEMELKEILNIKQNSHPAFEINSRDKELINPSNWKI